MPSADAVLLYSLFLTFIGTLLLFNLLVLNRSSEVIHASKALRQAGLWATLGLSFSAVVYWLYETHTFGLGVPPDPSAVGFPASGKEAAALFIQGYLLELMLSLDNMMVIGMVMTFFAVPPRLQHRVLFWGIIGAVVLRALMIAVGAALVQSFDWIIYVFGAILLFSAYKLLFLGEGDDNDLSNNRIVRIARAIIPVSPEFDENRFFTKKKTNGHWHATPLFLALVVVELIDVVFAVDSIPAIFGITRDPFIVLSSNCFAILGLRALYFAVAALVDKFKKLKLAMIVILIFIGVKMLLPGLFKLAGWAAARLSASSPEPHASAPWSVPESWLHLVHSPFLSLFVILGLMGCGILWSIASPQQRPSLPDERPSNTPPTN